MKPFEHVPEHTACPKYILHTNSQQVSSMWCVHTVKVMNILKTVNIY